jgi:LysM repeat protein
MSRRSWTFAASLLPLVLAACGGGSKSPSPSPTVTASVPPVVVATVAPASAPALTPTTEGGAAYTVKSGDTLSKIAAANNSTVDAIVKANNLTDPDKLQVGQKLAIPSGAETSGAAPAASVAASGLPPAASKPPPP